MFWLEGHTITEVLLEGEVTTLYRGYRDVDGAPVLVKALNDDYPLAVEVARLRHEYLVMRDLDVPCVPEALGLGTCRNGVALVLSDTGKRPLTERLRRGRMELGAALRIGISLASALERVHLRGVIHKDVCPANILVDEATLEVELLGFGHAVRLLQEDQRMAPPGLLEGTLAYMAPEQTGRMNRVVDQRADLYALGVTLYELITGALPFAMDNPLELVHAHIARAPARLVERVPDVPRVLSDVVGKLLEKSADDRYQRARGVEADLATCLARWETEGFVAPFALGTHDLGEGLALPQKLYGREAEREALLAAFEGAAAGRLGLVLVKGPAGSGKSALVRELSSAVASRRGYLVTAAFDAIAWSAPYAAIALALRDLVRQIFEEPDGKAQSFARELVRALGPSGHALAEMVPEIGGLLGESPQPIAVAASASASRLAALVRVLLGLAATRERPLVLFLDDAERADPASLELMRSIVEAGGLRHLLVVIAHRERPEGRLFDARELRRADVTVTEVALGPLSLVHVRRMLADALCAPEERVADLAEALSSATQGSAFFLHEVLRALHAEGLLRFDPAAARFQWDIERVRRRLGAADAHEFVKERIEALPEATRALVVQGAYIGERFDLGTLALVAEKPAPHVAAALWPALGEGLLLPLSSDYRLVDADGDDEAPPLSTLRDVTYAFAHEHVHEAAYGMLPAANRPAEHRRIGRLLMGFHNPEDAPFAAVRQLNLGLGAMTDPAERLELADIDLAAGERAKRTGAFADARDCLARGLLALGDRRDADVLWFDLSAELCECSIMTGPFEEAERLCGELERRARSRVEHTRACRLRVALLVAMRRPHDAFQAGLRGLAALGVVLPEGDEARRETLARDMREMSRLLAGRPVATLVEKPRVADPEMTAAMELLLELFTPATMSSPTGAAMVTARLSRLSIEHGHSEVSACAYAAYGFLLATVLDRPDEGLAFGELALALEERTGDNRLSSRVHLTFGAMVHWKRPRRVALIHFQRAAELSQGSGDLLSLSYAATQALAARLDLGDDLARACDEAERRVALIRASRDPHVAGNQTAMLAMQAVRCLLGRTRGRLSLSDDAFDEEAFVRAMDAAGAQGVLFWYHAVRAQLCLLHEDLAEAAREALLAEERLGAVAGQFFATDLSFYLCIALLQASRFAPLAERPAMLAKVDTHLARLAAWSERCPENYERRLLLVQAERARATGDELGALSLYEKALRAAAESGASRDEALANELAARFHLERRRETVARAYMAEAYQAYLRWGATAKVDALRERHAALLPRRGKELPAARPRAAGDEASGGMFDLPALMRATQAIAEEIVLDSLLDRVMRSIVASAGAQRAVLLLDRGSGLAVEACMTIDPDQVLVGSRAAAAVGWELPQSVVDEVERTRQPLVLGGSRGYDRFSKDPYLMERRPRSLLCLAMAHRGRRSGILYLENRSAADAFNATRVEVASFLSSQAAIAVENALLVQGIQRMSDSMRQANERLESEVHLRTAELERELGERERAEAEKATLHEAMLAAQEERLLELSTPLLPITDEIVVMPLIGTIDTRRAAQVLDTALSGVASSGASMLILDITGVKGVDERVARALIEAARSIGLLGAEVVITGVRAQVARTLMDLDVDMRGLSTKATLKGGIAYAIGRARGRRLS
jgi:predicted ATPase/anti-anti-sigma regulatory factor